MTNCKMCGEPLPPGTTLVHSGPCPKPERTTSEKALEIAARIWQDQDMRSVVMDMKAVRQIAAILETVIGAQQGDVHAKL